MKQVLMKILGLFGYGKPGRFAKVTWGIFASAASVAMVCLAVALVYDVVDYFIDEYNERQAYDEEYNKESLSALEPVCFRKDGKYGFFDAHSGEVIVEPRYDDAARFSEGLLCVVEDDVMSFVDTSGKRVFEVGEVWYDDIDEFVFHHGYCVMSSADGKLYYLIDRNGKNVTQSCYSLIEHQYYRDTWLLKSDGKMTVLDSTLKTILPYTDGMVSMYDDIILVIAEDNTAKSYNYDGTLKDDFVVSGVEHLEYQIEYYRSEEDDEVHYKYEYAQLLRYEVLGSYGLMRDDGTIITLPSYSGINAINDHLYECWIDEGVAVIIDGEGRKVK